MTAADPASAADPMSAADPVRAADSVRVTGARHVAPPAASQAGYLTLAQIP